MMGRQTADQSQLFLYSTSNKASRCARMRAVITGRSRIGQRQRARLWLWLSSWEHLMKRNLREMVRPPR
jgi:hypothetical protein